MYLWDTNLPNIVLCFPCPPQREKEPLRIFIHPSVLLRYMGYVRYKLSDETHDILRRVSRQLGMKESEISRIALMEYLRSLSVLSERVNKKKTGLRT